MSDPLKFTSARQWRQWLTRHHDKENAIRGPSAIVGGEPGIGKSTLRLQAAQQLAKRGAVLYVSGEESPRQIALRARRLGTTSDNIRIYTETSVERIVAEVEAMLPVAVIVDS